MLVTKRKLTSAVCYTGEGINGMDQENIWGRNNNYLTHSLIKTDDVGALMETLMPQI